MAGNLCEIGLANYQTYLLDYHYLRSIQYNTEVLVAHVGFFLLSLF